MTPQTPRPPGWRRRPIFLWQARVLLSLCLLSAASHVAPLLRRPPLPPRLPHDPCALRPTPRAAPPPHAAPSLVFVHLPKTAGTLMYSLLMLSPNRTGGLACNFVHDGDSRPPSAFVAAARPQAFPPASREARALAAIAAADAPEKARLLRAGVCRALRGHVTFNAAAAVHAPVLTVTILRDPLARFVSMYEFVLSMLRPPHPDRNWMPWMGDSPSLAAEFANSSSLLHRAFYDDAGNWVARDNAALSFHFYGVLHQLSGLKPVFEGVGDPFHFAMRNDAEMAERAKDNLCATHILGAQESMDETWRQFFAKTAPYTAWTDDEKRIVSVVHVNRNPMRRSRNVNDHLPERIRIELERRLSKEIEVVEFGRRIIEYRKALREATAAR